MSCTDQEIITQHIALIAPIAEKLPGVVIIHDLRDWSVAWMSPRGLKLLGITLEELISLTAEQYYARYFNAEDAKDYVPKIIGVMERNIPGEICTFFQQVRFADHADWKWHMASTMVLAHDALGKPLLIISLALTIDAMHHMTTKVARLLEENNFLRKNYHLFSKLSKREQEVLKWMALGKSSVETAQLLFISQATVDTHRKNIKQKLQTSEFFQLSQYARAFDLI